MIVIALNRRRILTTLKVSLIILAIFSLIILIFEQLPTRVTLEKLNSSNDHPGRILRVNFDEQPYNTFGKTIKDMKDLYQAGAKNH